MYDRVQSRSALHRTGDEDGDDYDQEIKYDTMEEQEKGKR
jgi:hypothetical protein